ncbi:MAG: NAD(+)/NADH kinase [Dehalococcoidia bacterium]|nr:NAD(+)/NADH kinase [Dehalococcoidia bacterium]
MANTDIIFSIGGDGTILKAARYASPRNVPIVGINMGNVGFLTELNTRNAIDQIPLFLSGEGWMDKRAMLEAELISSAKPSKDKQCYHALNDVVVARAAAPRLIHIKVLINNTYVTTYRTDGIIISTATGSTAYSLASGGPILYPQSTDIILSPISSYLSIGHTLVIPSTDIIEIQSQPSYHAMLSIDGQINIPFQEGDRIKMKRSPYVTRFLRLSPPSSFYNALEKKLKEK